MKLIQYLLIFIPYFIMAQNNDCKSTFEWTKKTFEENDAGFQYIIDTKGIQAYNLHNINIQQKINDINNSSKCHEIINEWLSFFRKGHIGLQFIGEQTNSSENKTEDLPDWETYPTDINKFKNYLADKGKNSFEGIWKTGSYKIGIKLEGEDYIGFIIESNSNYWKKNEVKLKILNIEGEINSVYYMGDRSEVKSKDVKLHNAKNLQIGEIYLKKTYPEFDIKSDSDLHFKAINTELPFLIELNETTLYFRIPSFTGTPEKRAIDSVISLNREKILSTENLIIDIRYGTGGSDQSYYELIPLLYTNPIRTPGMKFLSTPLNNQRMLDFSTNTGLTLDFNMKFNADERKEFKQHYEKLSKHIGEFVNIDSTSIDVTIHDTIYPFPKNVGIIHNHKNGSTDEQFLLAAKQSKKVKLFGRTTMGTLDFSNMNKATSPNGNYALWYTLSKSNRIPGMAIDGKGIQPDYYIDKEIPETKWIEYVTKILNE